MRRACQKCLFGWTHRNFGFHAALRVITGLTALATMGNVLDILELNNGELCVLRWLRISGGKATLSTNAVAGNSLFAVPAPLLKAGYVKTHTDPSSPKTVHYTLTAAGLEALEVNESKAFFGNSAKRRRRRASMTRAAAQPWK
jgi:hypothetical protein